MGFAGDLFFASQDMMIVFDFFFIILMSFPGLVLLQLIFPVVALRTLAAKIWPIK
jgi:hypothetical protein